MGVAYYPEHRDPKAWLADMEKARDAGIQRMRIGEFSWSRLEPQEGVYNWEWLDLSLDLAAATGIEVVLCTPTACPPIWLAERYPEILPADKMGRRTGFGARQHRCFNAPAYIEHSRRIVDALGQRYGAHPNVVAWQLDNELGGEQKHCYCDHCRRAFQAYLQQSYGTIEALNERWGTVFWSQEYQSWSQIPVPLHFASDLAMRHHPSLELAFSRFSSDSIVRYSRMQCSLLHSYAIGRPITTNAFMFRWGDNVNWHEVFRDLDVAGIDIYSEQPHEIAFYVDFARSLCNDACWSMEYGVRSEQLHREMDLLAAHGCEWLFFFKMNPFPWGQEQSMRSMLTITGETTLAYETARQWRVDTASVPTTSGSARAGLIYDFESAWAHAISESPRPLAQTWTYSQYAIDDVYRCLFELDIPVRILGGHDAFDDLDVLVLPMLILHDAALERRLIEWVRRGGKLIATADLFQKNADNVFLQQVPSIYRVLFDWQGQSPVDQDLLGEEAILLHNCVGQGQAWLLRTDAARADWARVMVQALA